MSLLGLVCYRDGKRELWSSAVQSRKELTAETKKTLVDPDLASDARPRGQGIDIEWFPAGFPDSRREVFGDDAIACSDLPPYDPKPYSIAMFVVVLVFAVGVTALLVMSLLRGRV